MQRLALLALTVLLIAASSFAQSGEPHPFRLGFTTFPYEAHWS